MSMGTDLTNNNPYGYGDQDHQPPSFSYSTRNTYISQMDQSDSRPFSPVPHTSAIGSSSLEEQKNQFASLGAGVAGWISEHFVLHPFVVIRRQCQVSHNSYWYHTTPFTLVNPMFNLQRQQNINALWKGVVSTLVVKAIGYVSESTISEITSLPKEVTRHSSLKKIAQHLFLKSLSFIVVTPFYAASLVETVQAIEKDIEHPGVLDWLKEGVTRIFSFQSPSGSRQLMVWKLVLPTVVFGVAHYVITSLAQYNVALMLRNEIAEGKDRYPDKTRDDMNSIYETYYPEIFASFIGHLLADITLFPLETVIHRLFIQGTRTIIDNMDTGLDVIPTNTCYEGPLDCIRSIIQDEGVGGFYKGFGALILQYGAHIAILKIAKFALERFSLAQDNAEPMLGSDFARMQNIGDSRMQPLETGDFSRSQNLERDSYYSTNRVNPHAYPSHSGEQPSFNMERSYSTSTPYMTPTSAYRSHTGTGVAQK